MPITRIPIGSVGVEKNKKRTETIFSDLDNCVMHHGTLRVRPGVQAIGPIHSTDGTEPGIPTIITALDEPTVTQPTQLGETLRPNATSSNNWTLSGDATAHACLDDNPPDDFATKIVSASDTSKAVLGFSNTTKTYNTITGALIRFRARNSGEQLGLISYLKVSWAGSTEIQTVPITACFENGAEGDIEDWQEICVPMYNHPLTGGKMSSSTIDNMTLGFELVSPPTGLVATTSFLGVNGNGNSTDFGSYSSMLTTGAGFDNDETPIAWFSDASTNINSTTYGDKQSFTFKDLDAEWASVESVEVRFDLRAWALTDDGREPDTYYHPTAARLFHEDTGGTITYIDSVDWVSGSPDTGALRWVLMTEDPDTGSAWTIAGVNNAKFGVEHLGPDGSTVQRYLAIDSAELVVRGTKTITGNVELDYIAVDVYGPTGESTAIDAHDRIFATTKNFYRLDSEASGTGNTLTDISGTTTTPTAPFAWKWDAAVLYGQVWLGNGSDDLYYYPETSSSKIFTELASKPYGRTVASFSGRILAGDSTDAGSRTPQRVTYGKRNDATDWTADTAGYFDLLNTPGRVVKLLPFDESICVAYKYTGIYTIRQTGQDDIPFVPDLVDGECGCVAPATVKNVIMPNGVRGQIFLGKHPALGYTVLFFDGNQVANIGEPIRDTIKNDWDPEQRQNCFAEIDPRLGHYYLFYPDSGDILSNKAWVMDLDSSAWTPASFSQNFTAAGQWKLSKNRTSSTVADADHYLILGGADGMPYFLDEDVYYDALTPPSTSTFPDNPVFQGLASEGVGGTGHDQYTSEVTQTIVTGDLVLSEQTLDAQVNRIFFYYVNKGACSVSFYLSLDGGNTWSDAWTQTVGFSTNLDSVQRAEISMPDNEHVGRFIKVKVISNSDRRPLTLVDMFLHWEPRGEAI
jgi:hypothetical protein